jgi:hypothetical protein
MTGSVSNIAALRAISTADPVLYLQGYYALGDGGQGMFVYNPGDTTSADNGGTIIVDAAGHRWYRDFSGPCSVRWFGAKGDGATDDLAAIQAANNFVAGLGGGGLFFPAGHYLSAASDGIHVKSNVEYFGEGYASFLDFNWNVFQSAVSFGRGTYGTYTYYPLDDFASGVMAVQTTSSSDAGHFNAGDVLVIASTAHISTGPGDVEPYFVEVNRVVAADASTGVITLEDPIADGCTGVQIAQVNGVFAQNFSIHDLRCRAALKVGGVVKGGAAWKISACYKASIHDCWGEGAGLYAANGLVRSTIHDIIYKFNVVSGYVASFVECATGSHQSAIYNIQATVANLDGVDTYAGGIEGLGVDEFSRRIVFHDIVVEAPEIDWKVMFDFGGSASACQMWDISFTGHNCGLALQYQNSPSQCGPVRTAPVRFADIHIDLLGQINEGVAVTGDAGDPVANVSVKDFRIDGVWGDPYSIGRAPISLQLLGDHTNCEFDGLWTSGGYVYADPTGTDTNLGTIIKNSVLGEPLGLATVQSGIVFESIQRAGSQIQGAQRAQAGLLLNATTAHHSLASVAVPQNSPLCQGDVFLFTAEFVKAPGPANCNVEIAAFGSSLKTIAIPTSGSYQTLQINGILVLMNGSFQAPSLAYIGGSYALNGAIANLGPNNVAFNNGLTTNAVNLNAWIDNAADNLTVLSASVQFVGALTAP